MPPSISVIMPVYNGEEFLAESINSILAQTYSDFEFIIVDDASTDSTPQILEEYTRRDSRIRIITNATNKRVANSMNDAHGEALGKYIARMDSDDIAFPERFAKQVAFLEDNPDIDVCGTQAIYHETGRLFSLPTTHQELRWTLLTIPPLANPTSMVKRSLILKSEGFDPSFLPSADYEFWLRLFYKHNAKFANLSEPLLRYRAHPTKDRKEYKSKQVVQRDIIRMKHLAYVDDIFDTNFVQEGFPGITNFDPTDINVVLKCSKNFKKLLIKNERLHFFPQDVLRAVLLQIMALIKKVN
ncbi:glycosyltransferase family A protein [Maridesulfovibrio ferrireducens]|uniref:glycosyltransferase family 2 protein n=1 Tax=Maridesulfovibrio ferrireducens TaxID=246191 RepID=UPI001A35A9B0|nr:glycosyltransferase family A protein [Maridesulfovibrio ferrireducens]MBI9113105.1 glycosyltransferase family 2 protein [Maridesulfovibrio ferrireducens]